MRRRRYGFLAAWLLLAGCAQQQSPLPASSGSHPDSELLFVSNEDSGDITIIGLNTNRVLGRVDVGRRPRGIRASSDGRRIYVALSGSPKCPPWMSDEECGKQVNDRSQDGIAVVDVRTAQVERILPGGSDPEQFDVNSDETRLYVSNEDAGTATIVDLQSGRVVSTVEVGEEPEGVSLNPDGSVVYVTGESDHDVTVIETSSATVIARIPVGLRPRDIVFSPDGSLACVSSEIDGKVFVIDARSHTVAGVVTLPAGSRSMGLAMMANGRTLFVANGRAGTVSEVNLETSQVIRSVVVGPRPWGLALSGDGKRLYSANGPSNDISVIDTASLTVLTKIQVGAGPWGVAVAPNAGFPEKRAESN